MKKLIKSLTVLAICIFFYDTASAQVTYDYDKEAEFTQYKTYSFGGWQEDSDKLINDLDKKRILRSIDEAMLAKGLTKAENPQILVSLFTKEKES